VDASVDSAHRPTAGGGESEAVVGDGQQQAQQDYDGLDNYDIVDEKTSLLQAEGGSVYKVLGGSSRGGGGGGGGKNVTRKSAASGGSVDGHRNEGSLVGGGDDDEELTLSMHTAASHRQTGRPYIRQIYIYIRDFSSHRQTGRPYIRQIYIYIRDFSSDWFHTV